MNCGQRTETVVTKPSQSDDVLDATQQLLVYNQVRSQFDSLAPKCPIKPNWSEPVDSISPTIVAPDEHTFHLPELNKLRSLQDQSQTGRGFIKPRVDHNSINGYKVEVNNGKQMEPFKSNPATNDWTPKFEERRVRHRLHIRLVVDMICKSGDLGGDYFVGCVMKLTRVDLFLLSLIGVKLLETVGKDGTMVPSL